MNSDNINDGYNNQKVDILNDRRGDNNTRGEKKPKDVPIESYYDNGIDCVNDHINNNGMDNHDNGELILSKIMNLERSRAKKNLIG